LIVRDIGALVQDTVFEPFTGKTVKAVVFSSCDLSPSRLTSSATMLAFMRAKCLLVTHGTKTVILSDGVAKFMWKEVILKAQIAFLQIPCAGFRRK
jgi:hypothetical protein